ncbi:hypothetical protein ADK60_27480 [Streptomyces sp. XY431]|uniref:hypothetical protein n=1 Tax=Streptomyces sp. XY431 TaxID=1415562 RepID=UPI0006B019DC|nr:hypothetical protein [Streptomyces sp. XY431]KOV17083.1 hypothetical protein ADK60_27480 [Streptomyces sp. XY431]
MNPLTLAAATPVACLLIAAVATVVLTVVALRGTPARERALIIKALADLVRALRGGRRPR